MRFKRSWNIFKILFKLLFKRTEIGYTVIFLCFTNIGFDENLINNLLLFSRLRSDVIDAVFT